MIFALLVAPHAAAKFGGFVEVASDEGDLGDAPLPPYYDLLSVDLAHAFIEGFNETLVARFNLRGMGFTMDGDGVSMQYSIDCEDGMASMWYVIDNRNAGVHGNGGREGAHEDVPAWTEGDAYLFAMPLPHGCTFGGTLWAATAYTVPLGIDSIPKVDGPTPDRIEIPVPPLAPGVYDLDGTRVDLAPTPATANATEPEGPDPVSPPPTPGPSPSSNPTEGPGSTRTLFDGDGEAGADSRGSPTAGPGFVLALIMGWAFVLRRRA